MVSVGNLFAGAFLPGMLLVLLYLGFVVWTSIRHPKSCPALVMTEVERRTSGVTCWSPCCRRWR